MKKYLSSLLIIFSIAFAYNVNAQCSCPTGFTTDQIITTTTSGCPIIIDYCYSITTSGSNHFLFAEICRITFPDQTNTACSGVNLNNPTFWSWIESTIIDDISLLEDFDIPPCDEGVLQNFEISRADCWEVINFDPNPMISGDEYSILEPCDVDDPGTCYTAYELCYEGENLRRTVLGTSGFEVGDCSSEALTEPISPWGSSAGCFQACY